MRSNLAISGHLSGDRITQEGGSSLDPEVSVEIGPSRFRSILVPVVLAVHAGVGAGEELHLHVLCLKVCIVPRRCWCYGGIFDLLWNVVCSYTNGVQKCMDYTRSSQALQEAPNDINIPL